jgi:hypothetical protein
MTEERKRKKRSEKLSDSFAARLAREIGPSDRLDVIAGTARANTAERRRVSAGVASMQPPTRLGFMRCPHCREYVPLREACRACGGPMN